MKRIDEVETTSVNILRKPLRSHFVVAFWVSLIVAFGLIVTGFLMPPIGVIDGSVLTGAGIIFMWPTLALGAKAIEDGKTAKFKTSHTTLTVGDDSND
jgi:hypothetical protein